MEIDKRTFIIVVVIVVVVLPVIVLAFHKTFFPIIADVKRSFTSAALLNSTTGVPPVIMKLYK